LPGEEGGNASTGLNSTLARPFWLELFGSAGWFGVLDPAAIAQPGGSLSSFGE
jgi:hypothetical protein